MRERKVQIINIWNGLSPQLLQTLKVCYRNIYEQCYADKFNYLGKPTNPLKNTTFQIDKDE